MPNGLEEITVSTLPDPTANYDKKYLVTDCELPDSWTAGSGNYRVVAWSNGIAWVPVGGGGVQYHVHESAAVIGLTDSLNGKCANGDSRLSDARTPTAHAGSHINGGDVIALAVAGGNPGLMSGADKTKLNGVASGATVNSPDATLLSRANHTGSQAESTITNLVTDLAAKETAANKNAVNGYAGLNGSSKLNGAQQVYGSGSNTACEGNDARLSDARTPLAHTHPLADITNEGALAAKNTVATADIDNDAVTYAKIQNVTDARLLGRSAGSSGDAHEITVGSGLSLNAGALTATGGGGGVSQMIVPLISDAAGITWTNMPAAVTFFGGSHRFATKIDLTNYTQVRLLVNKQGTAGAAASVVRLRYRTAFDVTVGNWLTIGSSEVQVAVNVQNTVLDSGWINLVVGAKADVFVVLDGSGGDGVLDPVFGSLVAQFR